MPHGVFYYIGTILEGTSRQISWEFVLKCKIFQQIQRKNPSRNQMSSRKTTTQYDRDMGQGGLKNRNKSYFVSHYFGTISEGNSA